MSAEATIPMGQSQQAQTLANTGHSVISDRSDPSIACLISHLPSLAFVASIGLAMEHRVMDLNIGGTCLSAIV